MSGEMKIPEPTAKWDDPRVQVVYECLCSMEVPPPEKHWEGWTARRIVDALSASPPPPSADDGWLPIENGPKDGTMFIGWVGAERWTALDGESSSHAHDVSCVDFCWWRQVAEAPDGGYFDNSSGQIGDSQGVTHWMPLPKAPPPPAALTKEQHD